MTDYIVAETRL